MSEHSSSSSEEEEVWCRSETYNLECSSLGGIRAIRPEGPFHLPVTVYLARRNSQTASWEIDTWTEVHPGDTIFDVEWNLGLHRSGTTAGRLACPISREDLISRGEDPEQTERGDRVFQESNRRVEDLPGYFWEGQVFRIVWL